VSRRTAAAVLASALLALLPACAAWADTASASGRAQGAISSPGGDRAADAATLYNAGTVALTHQAYGPAVAFLLAASRLEPRASDIRANLERAMADAARAAGEDQGSAQGVAPGYPLAADESWWLAAALLAAGAAITVAGVTRRMPRPARWTGSALLLVGIALSAWLHREAWEEAAHPEAVVIVPSLSVERGPEEPSRPAVLLAAGERVRLGRSRGGLVEIRIGANRIGWAVREGLWRVSEAPRYTPGFTPG
jgi:hypothetical protein